MRLCFELCCLSHVDQEYFWHAVHLTNTTLAVAFITIITATVVAPIAVLTVSIDVTVAEQTLVYVIARRGTVALVARLTVALAQVTVAVVVAA